MAGDIGTSVREAVMLEKEMVEQVGNRVAQSISGPWRTIKVFLKSYIDPETLNECNDFYDIFKNLKSNQTVVLGFYETLIKILHRCDCPSAREVEAYQEKIFNKLPKEELDVIRKCKMKKTVPREEMKPLDLEAEMINEVKGRVGPSSKMKWKTYINYLSVYVAESKIAECKSFEHSFDLLIETGDIETGNYEKLIHILGKCDVPSRNKVINYEKCIKKKLNDEEQATDQQNQTKSDSEGSHNKKRKFEDDMEASTSTGKGEKMHKKENTVLAIDQLEDMFHEKPYLSIGRILVKWETEIKEYGTGFLVGRKYIMTAYHLFETVLKDIWERIPAYLHRYGNEKYVANNLGLPEMESKKFHDIIKKWRQTKKYCQFDDIIKVCQFNEILSPCAGKLKKLLNDTWTSVIQLGFIREDRPFQELKFKQHIPFYNEDKDVIILELDADTPQLSNYRSLPLQTAFEKEMHIIGHPNGKKLVADFRCKILTNPERTRDKMAAIEWCKKQPWCKEIITRRLQKDYELCEPSENNEDSTIVFHCDRTVQHGASGSPGLVQSQKRAFVQAMYLESCPKFFHGNLLNGMEKENFESDKLFEIAISMKGVFDLLVSQGYHDLIKDLFDSDIQMDTSY